ncbi:DUF499 domain-containing protein [Planktothricoides raciborskii]|uniref:DUF499 domain-containing protein n=1 Tax=Planktothricoides raciborskii FACHB-1370 TaxID=2949576 RepID=A0ABR8ELX6_9CYAN|nr:DUF499 domain-containing protein [Planktothricoides raciborskii]MBD2547773.1 DUF499 domain-containing protein [Planktothricoides raciborskii FACHB-1370]MBD2584464.1 DUF499 domain-containing protein [Planktothricoides raciborskii FACHB-1261]
MTIALPMNAYQLKFWQPVKPDPDIAAKNRDSRKGSAARHRDTHLSSFAAVVRQDPTCPQFYRDPHHFFNATYLTAELKQLFKGVLGGLCGEGQRIFSLERSGDISQTFLALYHLVKYRPELRQVTQFLTLPNPKLVQVAGLTNFDLEIKSGMEIKPGLRIFTPWGYLAWQLGGSFAYSLVKIHDEQRVAPSQYLLRQLLGVRPTLLLVEDFLDYVQNAIAILGIDDPFIPEILIFIENLIAVVEKSPYTVLVYSLPATETNLLTAVKNLLNPNLIVNRRGEAFGQESMGKTQQFSPRMLRPHTNKIAKNRQFSLRMVRRWEKARKNQAKYTSETSEIKEKKQAIAVFSLDEHTYYSPSVLRSKPRQKTPAKIWRLKSDRCPRIWLSYSPVKKRNKFIIENQPYLNFVSILRQLNYINKPLYQLISKHWDGKLSVFMPKSFVRIFRPYISGILGSDRSNRSINKPLERCHKLSEIDVAFKEVIARSPPKYYPYGVIPGGRETGTKAVDIRS